jgi:hypothetical protein
VRRYGHPQEDDIPDPILAAARRLAAEEGTTLRAIVEEGLRRAIDARAETPPFVLPDRTSGEGGLRPEVAAGDWAAIRGEGPGHRARLREAVACMHDARVAAICIHHDAELWTADRDLGRFLALSTRDPLVDP